MTLLMTLKMSSKLYTEEELGFDRVIEIRIRDLKKNKQKSFSLSAKNGTTDYISIEKLKIYLEKSIKDIK